MRHSFARAGGARAVLDGHAHVVAAVGQQHRLGDAGRLRMRDALAPHNKQVEWVDYPDEAHGFLLLKTRVDFWTRVERFLARELGAPNAAVASGS